MSQVTDFENCYTYQTIFISMHEMFIIIGLNINILFKA
jgi:hypothetical protein